MLGVVDLLSGNGTKLDGRAIEVAELPRGSTLTLGRVCLTYLCLSDEGKSRQVHDSSRVQLRGSSTGPGRLEDEAARLASERQEFEIARASEEDTDELVDRVTTRLVRWQRRKRWPWRLMLLAVVFVTLIIVVVALVWGRYGEALLEKLS